MVTKKLQKSLGKRKPNSKTKRFVVTLTAHVDISKDILKTAMSSEWARKFYTLTSEEQVACFIGRLFAMGVVRVDQIDGFADKAGDPSRLVCFPAVDAYEYK